MIEIAEFFDFLTHWVEEQSMSPTVKTLLVAIGAAAWAAMVTFFHNLAVDTPFSAALFTNLWHAEIAAIVPAVVAFFLMPPTPPPAPPAGK